MKLYLDTCCYNRPYDDQTQETVHIEGEAVLGIVNVCRKNGGEIIGSPVLELEIDKINDLEKMKKVRYFYYLTITTQIDYTVQILNRVQELSNQSNIRMLDKFHLSFAENSGADALLTTDIKFEKACQKLDLKTRVINPLRYLMEVIQNENSN
jgi:predicted nucleic acid-binding protein